MPTPPAALVDSVRAALIRLAAVHALQPVRRTPRLVLRPWQEADREPFAALNADPEGMEHFPAPLTRVESDALIDRFRRATADRGFGMFAVEERETRTFVGMAGLSVPAWDAPFTPAVEIGWRFARAAWGRGLATEAAAEVLKWAFADLRLPQVVSFTSPRNERSWRLMERLGMERVDTFDHPSLPEGHPLRPHVLYAIDAPVVATRAAASQATAAPQGPTAASPSPAASPRAAPPPPRPRVWIDGDGCPRVAKELVWRAVERGAVAATLVANRPVQVPRSRHIDTVVVPRGLDVADDWLVAHAAPGDLVLTSDVPLAAELVARGVEVLSPRGERFTPENMGEKLSIRDFFTEARASGLVEGGGPPPFDERARRELANGLERWIQRRKGGAPAPT